MKKEQLLSLSNKEIANLFNHKRVQVTTKDGPEDFYVKGLSLAANPPHLFVGFIREDNRHFGVEDIVDIEILNK